MPDFANYKVPIFPNINDLPREPTAERAGNISDLINRFNNLIDELSVSGDTTGLWSFQTPSSANNDKIELYYLNASEQTLTANAQLNLYDGDLIAIYINGLDYAPGDIIQFSSLVAECGVGYYFWLFKLASGAYKIDSWMFPVATPRGASKPNDNSLEVLVRDSLGVDHTLTAIVPLHIQMPSGNCSVQLKDAPFIGG